MRLSKRTFTLSLVSIFLLFCVRALTLGSMPLIDPSESRYALVAKLMNESGQYLIPQLINHQGVTEPFWGKPPLFFWLIALSYKVLGTGELASRLPSFLAMFLCAVAVFSCARKVYGTSVAWNSVLLLLTSGMFFVYGGLCQVDMLFTTCLTWAFASFVFWHHSIAVEKHLWAGVAAISIAAAFLTKGPLVLALLTISLAPWYFFFRRVAGLRGFPWHIVLTASFCLVAPWYVLAEKASPGLIRYFFLNENVLRFFVRNYGDRYGFSHHYFFGAIWLFALVSTLPWSLFALAPGFWRQLKFRSGNNPWEKLFLFWALSPVVLFTFSRHVLLSYVIPGIPGLSIALGLALHEFGEERLMAFLRKSTAPVGLFLLAVALISVGLLFSKWGISVLPEYNGQFMLALLGLLMMIGTLALLKKHWHPRGALSIIAGLLFFVLSTSAAIIGATAIPAAAFQPFLTERFPASEYELNFPFGIPYSAYIYLPHDLESAPEELTEEDDQTDLTKEAIIIPDSKLPQFQLALAKSNFSFCFVANLGSWRAYERCSAEKTQ